MKTFEEIRRNYHRRQRDTVVDAISTGLTYVDEIAVETGLLEAVGLMSELTESVCSTLPFVIIAASEGTKVVLGRKPCVNSLRDAGARMVKTGAALGLGSVVAAHAGILAALPVTMGVRVLFDACRSRALTGVRVQGRIDRLRQLNAVLREERRPQEETLVLEAEPTAALTE